MPYVNYYGARPNTVIFKAQNQMSAIDIQPMLFSYRKNQKRDEHVYAGRLAIGITSGGNYERAYITKGEAKAILGTIINGTFSKHFGEKGHQIFGGSEVDGKIQSRILKFSLYNGRFQINISTANGQKQGQGAIKPVGKPFKNVFTTLTPLLALEMAHEVLDYIRAAEVFGVSVDTPLHTMNRVTDYPPSEKNIRTGSAPNTQQSAPPQTSDPQIDEREVDLETLSNDEFKLYHRTMKEKYAASQKEVERRTFLHNQKMNNRNDGDAS